MTNSVNNFMDNMRLKDVNSLTHLLNADDSDELNIIRHSRFLATMIYYSRLHFITRCTRGNARSFLLYLQNVFVCTKRNFL